MMSYLTNPNLLSEWDKINFGTASTGQKKVVLIDDDRGFLDLVIGVSAYEGVLIDSFESLDAMGCFANLRNYDLAIIDLFLPQVSGLEIAEYVDIFFSDLPVILISASPPRLVEKPKCIREFINKNKGARSIIRKAQEIWAVDSSRKNAQEYADSLKCVHKFQNR